ncbi:FAD-dependent oxidoreductase [Microbulbifer yueqingensis]|uniref:Kynurenine 3-monooxygenase n=1 Tax=Microbulbifer yueqingensis TaxID=658219 RepID=A0A1G8UET2_9GAMM|nr:NAD(P)/FAD-dependent oxidoreductase [Microbulbifer yueqingensis]SDJ52114.1 kynurenine 3-monooxygenase [Microbulbifer yueqingensis]
MSENSKEKIVIAGAGLVGAMAACFLGRRGFEVEVYESRVDLRRHDISAGRSINLALANRGIYPLEQLGLMDRVREMMIPMRGRMIHDPKGEQNFQPYGQSEDEVIYSISRGDLNRLLLDAAEQTGNVNIHFSHRLDSVDFDTNSAVFINEETGSEVDVDFTRLVGADGAGSRVRAALVAAQDGSDSLEPLGHSYKELEIPAGRDGSFQIEKHALHIWPRGGFMLIALPNLDGSFTVTLFLPNKGEPAFETLQTREAVSRFFDEYFPGVDGLIPGLVDDFFANPTGKLGTVRCKPWHIADKAILIGDAAHAIVPFHGQGMNCGFEDCAVLDECIGQHGPDWHQVFAEYDRLRAPNGEAIADMALENYVEMRDSVNDPQFLLKKAIGFELQKRWPDLFTPRYGMVMFQRIPYAEAQRRGEINQQILDRLASGIESVEEIDWDLAETLVKKHLGSTALTA